MKPESIHTLQVDLRNLRVNRPYIGIPLGQYTASRLRNEIVDSISGKAASALRASTAYRVERRTLLFALRAIREGGNQ